MILPLYSIFIQIKNVESNLSNATATIDIVQKDVLTRAIKWSKAELYQTILQSPKYSNLYRDGMLAISQSDTCFAIIDLQEKARKTNWDKINRTYAAFTNRLLSDAKMDSAHIVSRWKATKILNDTLPDFSNLSSVQRAYWLKKYKLNVRLACLEMVDYRLYKFSR
jgi:hypothetical protein